MRLRGVFFGTSDFAVPALRAFAASVQCSLVVTQPARRAGRGQRPQATPVETVGRELGIATLAPERLREAWSELRNVSADLYAVASYGKIVPQALLDLPRLGALNVHPSLLPLYRGATPLQSQIRDGVVESGVTIILMNAGMDTGDIVAQQHARIGDDETYGELHDRFATLGAELLARACERASIGMLNGTPQLDRVSVADVERTLTRPLRKEDLRVLPAATGEPTTRRHLIDRVRSLAPKPGARIGVAGIAGDAHVLRAHDFGGVADGPDVDVAVGTALIVNGWMLIRASDGWMAVDELVVPGRRAMTIGEFRRGYRLVAPTGESEKLAAWYAESGEAKLLAQRSTTTA